MRLLTRCFLFGVLLSSISVNAQVNNRWRIGVNLGYGLHGQQGSGTTYNLAGAYRFGLIVTSGSSQVFQTTFHLQSFSERFKSEVNDGTYIKQFYGGGRLQVDVRLRINSKNRLLVGIAPIVMGKPSAQIELKNSTLTTSNSFSSEINAAQFHPSYRKFNAAMLLGWSYQYKDIVADLLFSYDALPTLKEPISWTGKVEGFPIRDSNNFNAHPVRLELAFNFLIRTNRTQRT